jgi:hypothetical protein
LILASVRAFSAIGRESFKDNVGACAKPLGAAVNKNNPTSKNRRKSPYLFIFSSLAKLLQVKYNVSQRPKAIIIFRRMS